MIPRDLRLFEKLTLRQGKYRYQGGEFLILSSLGDTTYDLAKATASLLGVFSLGFREACKQTKSKPSHSTVIRNSARGLKGVSVFNKSLKQITVFILYSAHSDMLSIFPQSS